MRIEHLQAPGGKRAKWAGCPRSRSKLPELYCTEVTGPAPPIAPIPRRMHLAARPRVRRLRSESCCQLQGSNPRRPSFACFRGQIERRRRPASECRRGHSGSRPLSRGRDVRERCTGARRSRHRSRGLPARPATLSRRIGCRCHRGRQMRSWVSTPSSTITASGRGIMNTSTTWTRSRRLHTSTCGTHRRSRQRTSSTIRAWSHLLAGMGWTTMETE